LTRRARIPSGWLSLPSAADIEAAADAPHVCPGCYAVGDEPCAFDCIDAERKCDDWDPDDDYEADAGAKP
jgi:hypothetical protein